MKRTRRHERSEADLVTDVMIGVFIAGKFLGEPDDSLVVSLHQTDIVGHRVDPQEIEECIMESQLLIEIAVIGIPDELLGNKLHALCVPVNKSVDEKEIRAFAEKNLPHHKVPSSLIFVKSLPKNANGKIDRFSCGRLLTKQ